MLIQFLMRVLIRVKMREMGTMIMHLLTTWRGFNSLKIKWIRVFGMVVNLFIPNFGNFRHHDWIGVRVASK